MWAQFYFEFDPNDALKARLETSKVFWVREEMAVDEGVTQEEQDLVAAQLAAMVL